MDAQFNCKTHFLNNLSFFQPFLTNFFVKSGNRTQKSCKLNLIYEFYANLESDKKVKNNLFEISLPQKSLRVAVFCRVIKNEKPHNTLLCE